MKALVTGANRGLGLGISTAMRDKGYEVFAGCRKSSPELDALGVRVVEGVDVGKPRSVVAIRGALGREFLDVVVCNAAINISYAYRTIEELKLEDVEEEYRVNTIGMVRTVQAALPSLREGAKIILLTTSGGTLGRNPLRGGSYGYRMSKGGINTFGFLLASELRPRGIAVRMISPGPVDTDMTRVINASGIVKTALVQGDVPDPVRAGNVVLRQIEELNLESTGSWIDQTGKLWA